MSPLTEPRSPYRDVTTYLWFGLGVLLLGLVYLNAATDNVFVEWLARDLFHLCG